MKFKSIILLSVSIMLLAAALFFALLPRQSTIGQSHGNFKIEDGADIARIEMVDQNGLLLVLEKDQNQVWWVNTDYRANEPAVRELVSTLRNLAVRLPVSLSEKDSVNKKLENEGLCVDVFVKTFWINLSPKIRFFQRLKRSKSFISGGNTPDGQSTYMRLIGSGIPFAVHVPGIQGGIGELFSASEVLWRDPVVVNLAPRQIKKIEVEFNENEQEAFLIDNQDGHPVLVQGGKAVDSLRVDGIRMNRFLESFTELHYERLLTGPEENARQNEMMMPHFLIIRITDYAGRETTIHFFRRKAQAQAATGLEAAGMADPNRFYIRVNGGTFALAQYFVFNRIMRPFSYFVKDDAN